MALRVDSETGRITGTGEELADLEEAVARAQQGAAYPVRAEGPFKMVAGERFDPPVEFSELPPRLQAKVPLMTRRGLRNVDGSIEGTDALRALDGQQVQLRDGRSYTIRTRKAQVVTRG